MFSERDAERASDLSAKRNIGLLLARLHGWSKIVFVDDDVTVSRSDNLERLGRDWTYQIAGMVCRTIPTTLWSATHVGPLACRRMFS